jgi:hypothetical protein
MHLLVDLATGPEEGGGEELEEEESGRAAAAAVMAPKAAAAATAAGPAEGHDLKVPVSMMRRHAIRLLAILGERC